MDVNIMFCITLKIQAKVIRQEKMLRNIRIGWEEMKSSLASIVITYIEEKRKPTDF